MLNKKLVNKKLFKKLLKQLDDIEQIYKTKPENLEKYFLETRDVLTCQLIKVDIEIDEIKLKNNQEKDRKLALKMSKNEMKKDIKNISDLTKMKIYNEPKLKELIEQKEIECQICFSNIEIDNLIIMDKCNHYFCIDCIENFLKVNIKDRKLSLKCPDINCKLKLDYNTIKLIATTETFELYEKYLLENTLAKDKKCKFCPRPDCGMAMYSLGNNPMLTCPKCNLKFCFDCYTDKWHDGVTCKNYKKWKKENDNVDISFDTYIKKKKVKKCPNCKVNIEKNGGCNHMHCRNCNHHFNWS